jgi:hypothetical protein
LRLDHRASILGPFIHLLKCLGFSNIEPFEGLCSPILRWIFDEQLVLPRLHVPSSDLQPSELETLWDIVTKNLPEHRKLLKTCYLQIVKETYQVAGIPIPE